MNKKQFKLGELYKYYDVDGKTTIDIILEHKTDDYFTALEIYTNKNSRVGMNKDGIWSGFVSHNELRMYKI